MTRTLALYGFAVWVYVAIISIVQPGWLGLRLTHFASFPHVDTTGEVSFAVSLASYFSYRLLLPADDRITRRRARTASRSIPVPDDDASAIP